MKREVLLDTGPLVASLRSNDKHYNWVRSQWEEIEPPLITCESVISEACFLLADVDAARHAVMELIGRRIIKIPFRLEDEARLVGTLMRKYSDVPMSVADACLVRMAEQFPRSAVFTLDSDFRFYRKQGRQVIPLILPTVGNH